MSENKIVDIENIKIRTDISTDERILKYIQDTGNPYNFKAGNIDVKVEYDNKGSNIQNIMENYIKNMYNNYR